MTAQEIAERVQPAEQPAEDGSGRMKKSKDFLTFS